MMENPYYHNEEEPKQPSLILPVLVWAGIIGCVIVLCAGLSGCATKEEAPQVCFLQHIGRTQDGLFVVRQSCMTEDQFAESQK